MTLQVVVLSGVIIGALAVLLAIQVVVMRVRLVARTRRADRFLKEWEPLLFQAAEADSHITVSPVARADRFTFLRLWNHLQASVMDDAKQRLNEVAHRLGIPATARQMLARGGLSDRLVAITTLGHLQDRAVWDQLCACAASRNVLLSLTAARALVQVDRHAAITHLMPSIGRRQDWPMASVADLLKAAGPEIVSRPLAQAALDAPPQEAPRLIQFLDAVHPDAASPAVREILRNAPDKEVIAACLRVLKDPEDLDLVRRFLDDPRWEIRVQAVKAVGRMGTVADGDRLAPKLADPAWWVRYRAAEALRSLLGDSPERIDRLLREYAPRLATDVPTHAQADRVPQ